MYRTTAQRGIAALAFVLLLALAGAQPAAAAADRKPAEPAGRVASFWTIVLNAVPGAHAALDVLTGWFQGAKISSVEPPAVTNQGWGIDPNGSEATTLKPNGGG
jgi:hypothetical protein